MPAVEALAQTMIEEHYRLMGRDICVRREDARIGTPYRPHGKTPSIIKLMKKLYDDGVERVACFASRGSDWAFNVAIVADELDMDFTIFAQKPSRTAEEPEFLVDARKLYNARVEYVRANHTQIMIAQARKLAHNAFFIPFGLELPVVMNDVTERLRGFKSASVVLCAGSGITLACLLRAAIISDHRFKDVRAVRSGRGNKGVVDVLRRHLTPPECASAAQTLQIVDGADYGASTRESAWPTHPFYERKAYEWLIENVQVLEEPIAFLNM